MYLEFSWQEFQNATSFPVNYKTFRFTSDVVEKKSEFEASFLSPFLLEALAPLNSQFDWQSSHFFPRQTGEILLSSLSKDTYYVCMLFEVPE